jgi:hypothetical protein
VDRAAATGRGPAGVQRAAGNGDGEAGWYFYFQNRLARLTGSNESYAGDLLFNNVCAHE